MKFRIIRKYDCLSKNYYYVIQQLRLWRWTNSEHRCLEGRYSSCKSADTALDDWYLQNITNDIILEKEY
jgi:hypothetical protein